MNFWCLCLNHLQPCILVSKYTLILNKFPFRTDKNWWAFFMKEENLSNDTNIANKWDENKAGENLGDSTEYVMEIMVMPPHDICIDRRNGFFTRQWAVLPRIRQLESVLVDDDWQKVCAVSEMIRDEGFENAISVWLNFLTDSLNGNYRQNCWGVENFHWKCSKYILCCWEDMCVWFWYGNRHAHSQHSGLWE